MRTLVDSILEEIAAERTAGAGALAKRGAELLSFFVSSHSGEAFLKELIDLTKRLILAQPSMAPFFHLANVVLLAAEDQDDLPKMKAAVKGALERFALHLRTAKDLGDRKGIDRIGRTCPHPLLQLDGVANPRRCEEIGTGFQGDLYRIAPRVRGVSNGARAL